MVGKGDGDGFARAVGVLLFVEGVPMLDALVVLGGCWEVVEVG
jgi:hypothetical protein